MADASPVDPTAWVPADTFGSRLARIRQAKGWNVLEAATACGVPDQSWRNWEDGRSPRDLQEVCKKLAKAVPCDYVWLIAGVESRATRSEKSERASHLRGLPRNKAPKPTKAALVPLLAST